MITITKSKVCPVCKTSFSRKTGKSIKAWEKQVCCGTDCGNIYKRKDSTKRKRRVELIPGNRQHKGKGNNDVR